MGDNRRQHKYYIIDWCYPAPWYCFLGNEGAKNIVNVEVISEPELNRRRELLQKGGWWPMTVSLFSGTMNLSLKDLVVFLSDDPYDSRLEEITELQYRSFLHMFRKSYLGLPIWKEIERICNDY